LRRIINPVILELFGVQFDERLEISKLTRLMPILTDDAAMRLSARAYTIAEEDIDQERLKIMRDSLLQPAGAKQQNVGQAAVRKNQVSPCPMRITSAGLTVYRETLMQKRTKSPRR
jgi:hypothetical protein